MNWPSKQIPHGGILHPAKNGYNSDNHKFIKVLLEESKMSTFQRRKNDYFLRSGNSGTKPLPKREVSNVLEPTKLPPTVLIRPGSSKKRTQQTIINSGAYEQEKFRPRPTANREQEKKKLQNQMAFGKDLVVKPARKAARGDGETEINRFEQLIFEIKERTEWLEQMEELGEADQHRRVIELQIEAKIREMRNMKSN